MTGKLKLIIPIGAGAIVLATTITLIAVFAGGKSKKKTTTASGKVTTVKVTDLKTTDPKVTKSSVEARSIKVFNMTGSASVSRDDKTLTAYEGMNLVSNDTLTVEENSNMVLKLDEDKYICLKEKTKANLVAKGKSKSTKTVLNVISGGAIVEVENKLSSDESFDISASNSVMSIRGTIVSVDVNESTKVEALFKCIKGQTDLSLLEYVDDKYNAYSYDLGEGYQLKASVDKSYLIAPDKMSDLLLSNTFIKKESVYDLNDALEKIVIDVNQVSESDKTEIIDITKDFDGTYSLKNAWQGALSAPNIEYLDAVTPTATAKYGNENIRYVYSTAIDGNYRSTMSFTPGTYYCKAIVDGGFVDGKVFDGLESDPVQFTVSKRDVTFTLKVDNLEAYKGNSYKCDLLLTDDCEYDLSSYIRSYDIKMKQYNFYIDQITDYVDKPIENLSLDETIRYTATRGDLDWIGFYFDSITLNSNFNVTTEVDDSAVYDYGHNISLDNVFVDENNNLTATINSYYDGAIDRKWLYLYKVTYDEVTNDPIYTHLYTLDSNPVSTVVSPLAITQAGDYAIGITDDNESYTPILKNDGTPCVTEIFTIGDYATILQGQDTSYTMVEKENMCSFTTVNADGTNNLYAYSDFSANNSNICYAVINNGATFGRIDYDSLLLIDRSDTIAIENVPEAEEPYMLYLAIVYRVGKVNYFIEFGLDSLGSIITRMDEPDISGTGDSISIYGYTNPYQVRNAKLTYTTQDDTTAKLSIDNESIECTETTLYIVDEDERFIYGTSATITLDYSTYINSVYTYNQATGEYVEKEFYTSIKDSIKGSFYKTLTKNISIFM